VKRYLCIFMAGLLSGHLIAAESLLLHDATPIRLRLNRNLSSADATVGEKADFEVLDDLKIDDILLVSRGGTAIATVTQAQSKRHMGRGGKLDVTIDFVRLANGDKIALRAVKETKGGGHTGAMTGAMVATAIVFFPAAPLFLFIKGKDVTIPKGTEITAYVDGEIKLERDKFIAAIPAADVKTVSASAAPPIAQSQVALGHPASLTITSEPASADIEVDGKFVGNTPSTFQVHSGPASVTVKKDGFKLWHRTMDFSEGSSISLRAELERETTNIVVVQPPR
jgi:hypothetical protein